MVPVQPVTAKYLYRGSTDRKLHFHEILLVLRSSASSLFTTGHQLKHPPFLSGSACCLLSATQARDCTPLSAEVPTEGNTESGSLLIKLFMLWLCLVSGPFLEFHSPFLPMGTSYLHCLFHHHLLFVPGALVHQTRCRPKLLQWPCVGLVLLTLQPGLRKAPILATYYSGVNEASLFFSLPSIPVHMLALTAVSHFCHLALVLSYPLELIFSLLTGQLIPLLAPLSRISHEDSRH